MTQTVVVRRVVFGKNRPYTIAGISLFMAVLAAIFLAIGITMNCNGDSSCDFRKDSYIISGSFFIVSSVCFLFIAITLYIKIKKAIRENQSESIQVVVPVSPVYPARPVVTSVTHTQYSPPYSPREDPSPYPQTPPDQTTQQAGSAVSQPAQPTTQQVTEPPPPYVP